MVKPLQTLLEREFRLCYRVPGFTLSDLRQTGSRMLDWFDSRLQKQLQDEDELMRGK
jgi:hypothetical protein